MGIYIYPTDIKWFRFLRYRSPLDEVNFWQPGGGTEFRRLQPGELFLFRLKSPVNRIAGGGVFEHASLFPLNAAWEAFGEKNGVASFRELAEAIGAYRHKMGAEPLRDDSQIGCIILQSPFFLPDDEWIEVPEDYHANLVQGKYFPDGSETADRLLRWASEKLADAVSTALLREAVQGPMFGDPSLARRRLGQGAFRVLVADAYDRRCAVTGEKTLPVLEAAHIQPVAKGGEHRVDNGLLLRSDLHKLFDLGYVTITTAGLFRVSPGLRDAWHNGRIYYDLDGAEVRAPRTESLRPAREALEWHNDVIFRP
jgi:putative restriction endonuclease